MPETAEPAGLPPINLHANSYNLQDLEKASKHAEGLKTDEGRDKALGEIADKLAQNQEVLAHQRGVAVPEHHELGKIEDASGNVVMAPVYVPSDEAEQAAADAEAQAGTDTENGRRGQGAAADAKTDKAS
jgi:hypothetical protein